MCGYCIETAMLDLLEQEVSTPRPDKDEEVSPLFESLAQETNFLMHSLKLARNFHMMMDEIFYIAHCRAIEEIVHHPHTAMKDGLPQIALIKHLHGYKKFVSTKVISWSLTGIQRLRMIRLSHSSRCLFCDEAQKGR